MENNETTIIAKDAIPMVPIPGHRKKKIKGFLFLTIWMYIGIRFFVVDIDALFFDKYVNFDIRLYVLIRFFFSIIILMFTWIYFGNKRFWKNIGWFVLFPLYPLLTTILKSSLWGIPKYFVEKNKQGLLFNYFDILIAFLFNFKKTIAKFSLELFLYENQLVV